MELCTFYIYAVCVMSCVLWLHLGKRWNSLDITAVVWATSLQESFRPLLETPLLIILGYITLKQNSYRSLKVYHIYLSIDTASHLVATLELMPCTLYGGVKGSSSFKPSNKYRWLHVWTIATYTEIKDVWIWSDTPCPLHAPKFCLCLSPCLAIYPVLPKHI